MRKVYLEYTQESIYPKEADIFRAFELTPVSSVKVVIVGQDPYYNKGEANGLAFGVSEDSKVPGSLRIIFDEVRREFNLNDSPNKTLVNWATQGVLLLNRALTVRHGQANSHKDIGWYRLTAEVITELSATSQTPIVFMLWGAKAQFVKDLIDKNRHWVLLAGHPSPANTVIPFVGCDHFITCNRYLERAGLAPIDWSI